MITGFGFLEDVALASSLSVSEGFLEIDWPPVTFCAGEISPEALLLIDVEDCLPTLASAVAIQPGNWTTSDADLVEKTRADLFSVTSMKSFASVAPDRFFLTDPFPHILQNRFSSRRTVRSCTFFVELWEENTIDSVS